MEGPVENIIDLGLVNYVQHPENKNYVVFRFSDSQRAASFESHLLTEKIWFEKGMEEKKNKEYTLFGIHHRDFKKAESINYKVESKHKKPLIPNTPLRWFVVGFGIFILTLTLIGYFKAQNTLVQANKTLDKSMKP